MKRAWLRECRLSWILFAILLPVMLLFAPLVLSWMEFVITGSNHVEEFFETIGLHDFLSEVYRPVTDLVPF